MTAVITDIKDGPVRKCLLIFGVLVCPYARNVLICMLYTFFFFLSQWGLEEDKPGWEHPLRTAGLCFWLGLWYHEWSIFLCKYSVWLSGARHSRHSLRPSPVLRRFSFHDTGEHIAARVLEHCVFGSACEKKKWYTLLVILTHLLVSAPSVVNTHCGLNLVSECIMLVLMGIWPFSVSAKAWNAACSAKTKTCSSSTSALDNLQGPALLKW